MADQKPITAEEYRKEIERARKLASRYGDRPVADLHVDPETAARIITARVLLALAGFYGFYRDMPDDLELRDWADHNRERIVIVNTGKSAIATRHGLPVGRFPCPECGGSKMIVSQIEIEPILTDTGCIGAKRTPTFVPCPTCQGGR